MIEVTDEDVAEALRLGGYADPDKQGSINWVRDKAETCHTPELLFAHAQTIAKLRVAMEALERVNKLPPCDGGTENARASQDMRNTEVARLIARQALTQIKDTGQ